jgi:hypothetical protein
VLFRSRITGVDPSGYNISSGDLKTIYSATASSFVVEKVDTGTYVSGGNAYAKSAVNPDLGFAGGYNDGTYAHAGLFRDASDGVFKFFKGYTPEPDAAVNIDTADVSFSFAPAKVDYLDVVDASTTRTNIGLGTMAVETASDYLTISSASTTYSTISSPTFTGTVSIPTLNLTNALGYQYGGTGLTTLGTAGQVLAVNASATAVQWITPSAGGGGSSAAAVTSDPPASPELNQVWQDLDTGRIYVWNGTFWIEVQQNGSLGLLRYLGASSTEPVNSIDGSDLEIGEVYFDTVTASMKVYDGNFWQDAFGAALLGVSRWTKTAGAGSSITTLSGSDDYSNTLQYTAAAEQVFVNGVLIVRGVDYTATDGVSVLLNTALVPGDVVEIVSYVTFSVADTYTKLEVDGKLEDFITLALSDEVSTIATGTSKVTFRAPFAMTLTQIPRASLNTASTSGNPTVDINKNGTSILGANKLSIDANEKTSVTATTATTLSSTSFADDDEITFDIDVAGTGAKGLKVVIYYKRA